MIQNKENSNHYIADEGKTFVRKADGRRMGAEIWLGVTDSIENYEEREVGQITKSVHE